MPVLQGAHGAERHGQGELNPLVAALPQLHGSCLVLASCVPASYCPFFSAVLFLLGPSVSSAYLGSIPRKNKTNKNSRNLHKVVPRSHGPTVISASQPIQDFTIVEYTTAKFSSSRNHMTYSPRHFRKSLCLCLWLR